MKHFTKEEWIDFARDVIQGEAKSFMQSHLDRGCRQCAKEATLWARVSETARREAEFEPPVGAVRVAKAMMATSGLASISERKATFAELLFDSMHQAPLMGVRSAAPTPRQMLFASGDHRIDLRMEPQLDSDGVAIIGQVLDSANPERTLRNIPISLHSGKKLVAASETNHLGEFQLISKLDPKLELRATLPQGQQIRLALIELRVPVLEELPYPIDSKEDTATNAEQKKHSRKKL
jgi:hypothetical protein